MADNPVMKPLVEPTAMMSALVITNSGASAFYWQQQEVEY
jgi:hypothetical protein